MRSGKSPINKDGSRSYVRRYRIRGEGTAENCPIEGALEPAHDLFVSKVVKHTTEGLKTYLPNKCINLIDLKQLSH